MFATTAKVVEIRIARVARWEIRIIVSVISAVSTVNISAVSAVNISAVFAAKVCNCI